MCFVVKSGMRFLHLFFILFIGVAYQSQAQDAANDSNEWVIEYHQFPEPALINGFTSPKRGFIKSPEIPPAGANDETLLKFIKNSNDIVTHFLDFIGVASPKGAVYVFDPETSTLAARLPRGAQISIGNLAKAARFQSEKYLACDLTIFEAESSLIREQIEFASKSADHLKVLEALLAATDNGEAKIVASLSQEARSGQRGTIRRNIEGLAATEISADQSDWIEFMSEESTSGINWEMDPVIGGDDLTIDLNISVEFDYAPVRKRKAPITKRGGSNLAMAVIDEHKAKAITQLTLHSGQAKLLGVWKPESVEGRNDDVLQAALVEAVIVPVLPLPEPRVQEMLTNLGDQIGKVPEGPPQYENLPGELPPGMIVRRFIIPPTFVSSGGGGSTAAGDPFADPVDEPRFTKQVTAKEILEAAGIPFPVGSSANFIASTGELVVRNLPEHIELVEIYLSSITSGVEKSIGVTVHVVQGPAGLIRRLTRESRSFADHTKAWNELQAAAEQGQASIIRTIWGEGRSGQRFKVESGRNHPFNVGAYALSTGEPGAPAPTPEDNNEGEAAKPQPQPKPILKNSAMSGEIETRLVGTSLEVDPVLGADNTTIDLNLSFNYDYAPPVVSGEAELDANGNLFMDAPSTNFHRTEVNSSLIIHSGMIRIIGVWKPEGTPEFDQADILQAVLLKADVLQLEDKE